MASFSNKAAEMKALEVPFDVSVQGEEMRIDLTIRYIKTAEVQGLVSAAGNGNLNFYIAASGQPYFFTTDKQGLRTAVYSSVSLIGRQKHKLSIIMSGKGKREIYVDGMLTGSDTQAVATNNVNKIGLVGGFPLKSILYDVSIVSENGKYSVGESNKPARAQKAARLVPKKNLSKGFSMLDGKNPKLTVISDRKAVLDSLGAYEENYFDIPVKPYTTYQFSGMKTGVNSFVAVRGTQTGADLIGAFGSFNTGGNVAVRVRFGGLTQAGAITFEDFQIEEGSAASPYEPYTLINKPASPIRKAARLQYRFSFERQSVEVLDGVQYGLNVPRLKDGGVMVEEGTVNLLSVTSGSVIDNTRGINMPTTSGLWDITKGLINGATYTLSGWFAIFPSDTSTNERITMQFVYSDGTYDVFSSGTNKQTRDGKERFWNITGTANSTKILQTIRVYLFDYSNMNNVCRTFRDAQLEQKPYATSYTQGERKAEIMSAPVTLDGQGGSIEIVADFNRINTRNQYIFDTNNGRWLIFQQFSGYFTVYTSNAERLSLTKTIPDGKRVFCLEWDATTCRLYMDGVLQGQGAHGGVSNATTMYFGSRYNGIEQINGNIYACTIKDRNGNITFQF